MAQQICVFKKNLIDLSNTNGVLTVTDATATNNGQTFVDFIRNRNNSSAWLTTGSNDAANTQIDVDLGETRDITDIILVKHNWKAYTIKYSTDGVSYSDFTSAIAPT